MEDILNQLALILGDEAPKIYAALLLYVIVSKLVLRTDHHGSLFKILSKTLEILGNSASKGKNR